MHISWLQVLNQWLGIFYNGLQLKPCLETLHIILGVTEIYELFAEKSNEKMYCLCWRNIGTKKYVLKKKLA